MNNLKKLSITENANAKPDSPTEELPSNGVVRTDLMTDGGIRSGLRRFNLMKWL